MSDYEDFYFFGGLANHSLERYPLASALRKRRTGHRVVFPLSEFAQQLRRPHSRRDKELIVACMCLALIYVVFILYL